MERTWLAEDGKTTFHECNECGALVPIYNELCMSCQREEDAQERADQLDPYGYISNPGAF